MKKIGNKVGLFFLCIVPLVLSLALPLGAMIVCYVINGLYHFIKYGYVDFFGKSMDLELLDIPSMAFISEIVMVIGFSVIYYAMMKEKDFIRPSKCFSGKSFLAIFTMMVGAQCVLGVILQVVSEISPSVFDGYNEIMESVDLSSVWMMLVAVILAPIGEEIAFRGMTFKFARKLSGNFWIANIIQALCFGIAHGNIVQGSYAFGMGLVLGLLYKKYNSLIATMLAHLIFNFCGLFIDGLFYYLGDAVILKAFLKAAVGILLIWIAYRKMQEDPAAEKGTEGFNQRFEEELHPVVHQGQLAKVPEINNIYLK